MTACGTQSFPFAGVENGTQVRPLPGLTHASASVVEACKVYMGHESLSLGSLTKLARSRAPGTSHSCAVGSLTTHFSFLRCISQTAAIRSSLSQGFGVRYELCLVIGHHDAAASQLVLGFVLDLEPD